MAKRHVISSHDQCTSAAPSSREMRSRCLRANISRHQILVFKGVTMQHAHLSTGSGYDRNELEPTKWWQHSTDGAKLLKSTGKQYPPKLWKHIYSRLLGLGWLPDITQPFRELLILRVEILAGCWKVTNWLVYIYIYIYICSISTQ